MTAPAPGRERPVIRVLSVDGGGIRGMLPTRVLVALERMTGRPTADLFDLVAGTSTGALVALTLLRPGPDGRPLHPAHALLHVYSDDSPRIFPDVGLRHVRTKGAAAVRADAAQRVGAAARPKRYGNGRYRPDGIDAVLEEVMGPARLSEALAEVVVPAYDMVRGTPYLFSRDASRAGGGTLDPLMKEVALASTAAPTYFPPVRLIDQNQELCLIDGGFVANNPSTIGYYEALRWEQESGVDCDVVVVSLGSGHPPLETPSYQEIFSRHWLSTASSMLGVMFDGTSEISDALLSRVIAKQEPDSRYWRLQPELVDCSLAIDDASEGNRRRLLELGDAFVRSQRPVLEEIAALLVDVPPPPSRHQVPAQRGLSSPSTETPHASPSASSA